MSLLYFLKTEYKKRRQYFHEAKDEIARDNLSVLIGAELIILLILVLFMILTPYIVTGWKVTNYHNMFVLSMLLLLAATVWYKQNAIYSVHAVSGFCIVFQIIVYYSSVCLDTYAAPDEPAVFMPLTCIALPAIVSMPYYITYGILGIYEVIYIIVISRIKVPGVWAHDIFGSLVGIAISVGITNLTMYLRVRDYAVRMKYLQMSTKDSLANIFNKQGSMRAVKHYLDSYNPDVNGTMLILDLDDFKQINDTKGHLAGDAILRIMGETLTHVFRNTDIVGRFGGDEFIVLVKVAMSEEKFREKCRMILELFGKKSLEETETIVSCSIGAVVAQHSMCGLEELFGQADQALYEAKQMGKGQYVLKKYQENKEKVKVL